MPPPSKWRGTYLPIFITLAVSCLHLSHGQIVKLPEIAFDTSATPNDGYTVTTFSDDSDIVVIASARKDAKINKLGNWQVNTGSSWVDFDVINDGVNVFQMDRENASLKINSFSISKTAKVRFNLRNADSLWTMSSSYSYASLVYITPKSKTNSGTPTSLSKADLKNYDAPKFAIQLRKACNGKAGSLAKKDKCNICGGDGRSCLGCDGVVDSGAKYDKCGICTGGTTNKTADYLIDCAGLCDEYTTNTTCGKCQPKDPALRIDFQDCNGDCDGAAFIDECGKCVGGNTGKKEGFEMDHCGVCGGDNSTCTGCDGVMYGGKEVDMCGNCLHPEDKFFNANCSFIANVTDVMTVNANEAEFVLEGAGFKADAVKCNLEKADGTDKQNLVLKEVAHCNRNKDNLEKLKKMKEMNDARDSFPKYDTNKDKALDFTEFKAFAKAMGMDDMTDDIMKEKLKEMDTDKSGDISYKEFQRIMEEISMDKANNVDQNSGNHDGQKTSGATSVNSNTKNVNTPCGLADAKQNRQGVCICNKKGEFFYDWTKECKKPGKCEDAPNRGCGDKRLCNYAHYNKDCQQTCNKKCVKMAGGCTYEEQMKCGSSPCNVFIDDSGKEKGTCLCGKKSKNSNVKFEGKTLKAGTYDLKCEIDGKKVKTGSVKVIDFKMPTVTSYAPKEFNLPPPPTADELKAKAKAKAKEMAKNTKYTTVKSISTKMMPTMSSMVKTDDNEKKINVTVAIKGSGFVDLGDKLYCVALRDSRQPTKYSNRLVVTKFEAEFVDSTQINCNFKMSSTSTPGAYHIFLTAFVKDIENPKNVKYIGPAKLFAPAPKLLSAKMENNLRQVSLTFDKPAYFGCDDKRKCSKCNDLFTTDTKNKFTKSKTYKIRTKTGTKSMTYTRPIRCYWRSNKLYVSLTPDSSIRPNDNITLAADTVASASSRYSSTVRKTGAKTVTLAMPDDIPTPKVKLQAVKMVSECKQSKVSSRYSTGGGGQRLKFEWTAEFDPSVDAALITAKHNASLQKLQTYLGNLSPTVHTFYLKKDQLAPSVEPIYKVSVQAENFLGLKSAVESATIGRKEGSIPQVIVYGPAQQNMWSNRNNRISAYARYHTCTVRTITITTKDNRTRTVKTRSAGLNFNWEVDDSTLVLDAKYAKMKTLYIKKNTLTPGKTYTFTLTVSVKGEPLVFNTATKTVVVPSSPLKARIRGGKKRVVGSTSNIALDASRSYDPNNDKTNTDMYEWTCLTDADQACVSNGTVFKLPKDKKVIVKAGVLAAGDYTFKFNYKKGSRSASANMNVKIMPGKPPMVKILNQRRSMENVGRHIVVRAYVKTNSPDTVFKWGCVQGEDTGFVDLTNTSLLVTPASFNRSKAGFHRAALVFKPNALEAGVTYDFNLTASNTDGDGYAVTQVSTNAPPTVGTLEASPSNGTAMTTEFTIKAPEGWDDRDEDQPLSYQFGFIQTKNGKTRRRFLSRPSSNNEVTVKLPPGDADNANLLTVFVRVRDVHRAMSQTTMEVTVDPPTKVTKDVIDDVAAEVNEAFASQDISNALATVSSTLNSFSNATATEDVSDTLMDFKKNMTKNIADIVDTVEDKDTQDVVMTSVSEIALDGKSLDNTTKTSISSTVKKLVDTQAGVTKSSKRKRRSASQFIRVSRAEIAASETEEETVEEAGKTAEEVSVALDTFSNIIDTDSNDPEEAALKKELTDLSNTLLMTMCQRLSDGETPAVATSTLAELQSYKWSFEEAENKTVALGETGPSLVMGKTLADTYGTWNCDADEEDCNGACIGLARYTDDLYSSGDDTKKLSEVTSINFFNPSTSTQLPSAQLQQPIQINMPLKDENDKNKKFDCKSWDAAKESWVDGSCTAGDNSININGVSHVVCSCDHSGAIVTVTEAIAETTTQKPTTPKPNTPKPTEKDTDSAAVANKINMMALVATFLTAVISKWIL